MKKIHSQRVVAQCMQVDDLDFGSVISSATPTPEQVACLEQKYHYFKSSDFTFWVGDRQSSKPIRSSQDLLENRYAFFVFDFMYDAIDAPQEGLRLLISGIRSGSNGSKIAITFPTTTDAEVHGRYRLNDGVVMLMNNYQAPLTDTEKSRLRERGRIGVLTSRSISVGTLYHELGHKLMHVAYQGHYPDYEGHDGHDDRDLEYASQTVPAGAAWSEGFATAMGWLDFADIGMPRPSDFRGFPDWQARTLQDRQRNELAIAGVLYDLMQKCTPMPDNVRMLHCRSDMSVARKMITTLKTAGFQKNFQEFLVDYVTIYPQDRAQLVKVLERYQIIRSPEDEKSLFDYPNFKERYIAKKVEEYDALSPWSPILPNAAKAQKWAELRDKGIARKLMSKEYPSDVRYMAMKRIEARLDQVARDSVQINW